MIQPRFRLYSSDGCHLCEVAETLLGSLPQMIDAGCEVVDIAFDDQLTERFGSRIPVLFDTQSETYFDWPFEKGSILKLFD